MKALFHSRKLLYLMKELELNVRSVNTWFPENLNNKKSVIVRPFCIFSFFSYGHRRHSHSQAALLLPPERLGEVRRRAIFRTPISALLGGLLSENEGGQLSLRSWPPLKQWERCLRLSKNRGRHRFGHLICPESLLLHLQGKPFVNTSGRLL